MKTLRQTDMSVPGHIERNKAPQLFFTEEAGVNAHESWQWTVRISCTKIACGFCGSGLLSSRFWFRHFEYFSAYRVFCCVEILGGAGDAG